MQYKPCVKTCCGCCDLKVGILILSIWWSVETVVLTLWLVKSLLDGSDWSNSPYSKPFCIYYFTVLIPRLLSFWISYYKKTIPYMKCLNMAFLITANISLGLLLFNKDKFSLYRNWYLLFTFMCYFKDVAIAICVWSWWVLEENKGREAAIEL